MCRIQSVLLLHRLGMRVFFRFWFFFFLSSYEHRLSSQVFLCGFLGVDQIFHLIVEHFSLGISVTFHFVCDVAWQFNSFKCNRKWSEMFWLLISGIYQRKFSCMMKISCKNASYILQRCSPERDKEKQTNKRPKKALVTYLLKPQFLPQKCFSAWLRDSCRRVEFTHELGCTVLTPLYT